MNIQVNKRFIHYINDWNHYEYFLLGGYASSKSYNTAIKLILKSIQEKRKLLVVRDYYSTLKESCYTDLMDAIQLMGLGKIFKTTVSPLKIVCTQTGSEFIFRGMDNPGKIMSIKNLSVVWLEEGEGTQGFYSELKDRLRTKEQSLHIIITTNPKPKRHWTYQRFILESEIDEREYYKKGYISKNGIYLHHSTYEDNLEHLPQQFIDNLINTKDPRERKIKVTGEFGTTGLKAFYNVYKLEYDKVMEAIKVLPHHRFYNGMDFGFSVSYNALSRVAIDHEKSILYVYDEYYKNKMTDKQVANDPDFQRFKPFPITADSEDPKAIAYYNGEGYTFKGVKKGAGSVVSNIKKLRNFDRIIVADNCTNTWNELDGLEHKEDRWGEPQDTEFTFDAHTKDSIAYAIRDYVHRDMKSRTQRKMKGW